MVKVVTWAGGRMVKWLQEISVAPEESQNFYHFHDNRVLPPGVDQEKAKAEGEPLLSRPLQQRVQDRPAHHFLRCSFRCRLL